MIGQATSQKIRDKLKVLKHKEEDDEVKSNDSHGAFDGDDGNVRNPRGTKHSALLDDPFLQVDEP